MLFVISKRDLKIARIKCMYSLIVMKKITWSVFLILGVSSFVDCVPTAADSGNGYRLEILSKNNSNSKPTTLGSFADKLDFSSLYDSVVKNVVPALLQKHESGAAPGKETTHQLGTSITENLTKGLSDAFNSKLGQELMIAAGIKKRPTLLETFYETIMIYIRWIGTATSNKMHEIGQKGLMRTFSDTISGIFGSNSHITSSTVPHETHQPANLNGKNFQQRTEAVLQTRDIFDRIGDSMSQSRHHQRPGPWNSFLYQPYNRNNPYSTMPPFMGGGPIAYIGYLFYSVLYAIQEFFSRFFSYGHPPPPPPGGRPSLLRRPPQSYY